MNVTPLSVQAHRYIAGRWRRGEIGDPTRDAIAYTLTTLCDSYGNRPVSQLGPKAIDAWLESVRDRAPSTRRNYISRVRSFCRWLQGEGLIKRDPTLHVPPVRQPRKVPVTLTREQVGILHGALPDLRAEVVVAIMDGIGARCIEMANLEVEDFDPRRRLITLRGKFGNERTVTVPKATARLIGRYLDTTGLVSGPLIRSKTDPTRGLAPATFSHYLRDWMWAAGVKKRAHDGRSAHGLRRTCLSELMDACGNIRVVQGVAGHANIETTARSYLTSVTTAQMRKAMDLREQMPDPDEIGEAA